MSLTLDIPANQESTYIVKAEFYDENGNAVTPNSISWSLKDGDNNIVNGRSSVVVAVPASTVHIVLSGSDLSLSAGAQRTLIVNAVYDSDLAPNLPLVEYIAFSVE